MGVDPKGNQTRPCIRVGGTVRYPLHHAYDLTVFTPNIQDDTQSVLARQIAVRQRIVHDNRARLPGDIAAGVKEPAAKQSHACRFEILRARCLITGAIRRARRPSLCGR